jgi:hypothetical protein
MKLGTVKSYGEVRRAAGLSAASHARLRAELPFLPTRSEEDFAGGIEELSRKGIVMGLYESNTMIAFLGAFAVDNFRNAGPGAFGPDWCHGVASGADERFAYPRLYRELSRRLISSGSRIHAFAFYATDRDALDAMVLTGFGRIVLDAARPTGELLAQLRNSTRADVEIQRAEPRDALELARLNAELARHIGEAPVFMPNPRGLDSGGWEEWLSTSEHLAFLARREGRHVGYVKAQEPQLDVSLAVHGESTLAINGMYVEAGCRRGHVGTSLLCALAETARATDKQIVSVDCETANLEAFAFWSRWFEPIAWGLERRL